MKQKLKKLSLNRETVRKLTDEEVKHVAGGAESLLKLCDKLSFSHCSACCP